MDYSELYDLARKCEEEKNILDAIKYYKMAVDKGCDNAMEKLEKLYIKGGNKRAAIEYYEKKIDEGNDRAMLNLALLYHKEKNKLEAIKYYKMAIEKGNEYAMNNLVKLYKEVNSNYLKKLICEMNKLEDENEKLKKKNERLKTKLKYMPPPSGGIGYHEAKEDFDKLCGK